MFNVQFETTGTFELSDSSYRDYLASGTALARHEDNEPLQVLLSRATNTFYKDVDSIAAKNNFLGWIHYELGIAMQDADPSAAYAHYALAETLLPVLNTGQVPVIRHLESQKNQVLISLLRSRLQPQERITRQHQQVTIGMLGHLIVEGIYLAECIPSYGGRNNIRGTVSELAIAATLLIPGSLDESLIPAPASPRQDAPLVKPQSYERRFKLSQRQSKAHDLTILAYKRRHMEPSHSIDTQIKTRERDDYHYKYDPSILLLFADRDLFLETTQEFKGFGKSLMTYAATNTLTRDLYVARDNVELAYQLHTQT